MKRKIIIISLIILPILITVIFSICGDPSKLRWYELDTYRYDIFENNIENYDCIINIIRDDINSSNNKIGQYRIQEITKYTEKQQNSIKKVFSYYGNDLFPEPKYLVFLRICFLRLNS